MTAPPRYCADTVRAAVSLAAAIAQDGVEWDARKSRLGVGDYWAPCPFHGERTASFHVVEPAVGDGWFYCFGCGVKGGGVFDYIMQRDGVDFPEAVRRAAERFGVAPREDGVSGQAIAAARIDGRAAFGRGDSVLFAPWPDDDPRTRVWRIGWRAAQSDAAAADKSARDYDRAKGAWLDAQPNHPLLRTYFDARIGPERRQALWALYGDAAPPTLRLHPNLHYWADGGAISSEGSGMVGAVKKAGAFAGVHRTWLNPDGRGRDPRRDKRMLGACYGGQIGFTPPRRRMIVGEGIETTLAELGRLAQLGVAEDWGAVCALSLGAVAGAGDPAHADPATRAPSPVPDMDRPGWAPPDICEELVILGDGDMKSPDHARRLLARAQARHSACGRTVRVDWAGGAPDSGVDHADLAARGV